MGESLAGRRLPGDPVHEGTADPRREWASAGSRSPSALSGSCGRRGSRTDPAGAAAVRRRGAGGRRAAARGPHPRRRGGAARAREGRVRSGARHRGRDLRDRSGRGPALVPCSSIASPGRRRRSPSTHESRADRLPRGRGRRVSSSRSTSGGRWSHVRRGAHGGRPARISTRRSSASRSRSPTRIRPSGSTGSTGPAICARHADRVRAADDPLAALQRWLAELRDGHTWAWAPVGNLPYAVRVSDGAATFVRVPEVTAAFAAGVRPGWSLVEIDAAPVDADGWVARAAAPAHSRALIAGRRLLAGPAGTARALEAVAPTGERVTWEEAPTLAPGRADRRLPPTPGRQRVRADRGVGGRAWGRGGGRRGARGARGLRHARPRPPREPGRQPRPRVPHARTVPAGGDDPRLDPLQRRRGPDSPSRSRSSPSPRRASSAGLVGSSSSPTRSRSPRARTSCSGSRASST